MYKRTIFIGAIMYMLVELLLMIIYKERLFSLEHIVFSGFAMVCVPVFAVSTILSLDIEKELTKNIEEQVGKYKLVKRWGNLNLSYGTTGEILVISDDGKLHKLKLHKTKVVDVIEAVA